MSEQPYIPFHRPDIGEEEIAEVVDTLRSGWLTSGSRTTRFEQEFRSYIGARHALAVNSCTAALHLALAALRIGPGDEVITAPLTFCATVNVILQVGATPVLADVASDGNIDPDSVRRRITSRTRGIIPVHLAGAPCQMNDLWELAARHRLTVIEDAAHACGTLYGARHLGSADLPSTAVCFSFYATKNLTTGEGGMITTNDSELDERLRVLCLHGISKDAWNRYKKSGSWMYEVVEPGFKYNLSDIQSAVGIHQLRKLESFLAARAARVETYNRLLQAVPEIETPPATGYGRHAWHLYMIRLHLERLTIDRAAFIEELRQRNIGASVHFIPIPLHPFFRRWADLPANHCPQALALYPRLISLPLYPSMSFDEIEYVAEAVKAIAHKYSRTARPSSAGADRAAKVGSVPA